MLNYKILNYPMISWWDRKKEKRKRKEKKTEADTLLVETLENFTYHFDLGSQWIFYLAPSVN